MISISLQPTIYSDIITQMANNDPWGAPKGKFYLIENEIVPYGPKPTTFRIDTDHVNEAITIEVVSTGEKDVGINQAKNASQINVVSTSTSFTISLQLFKGTNRIRASVRDVEESLLIVNATTIVALWEAFVRVLYNNSLKISEDLSRAIFSKLGTRLIEPFIGYQDLLPESQSLQILSTRLLTRGLLHHVGTAEGVTDIIKALAQTTPVYSPMDKQNFEIFPMLDQWTKQASAYAGLEAHVWLPNVGIASWVAFLRYISNQIDYDIINVTEDEVIFRYQNILHRHKFDFDSFGTEFLNSLARSECFNSIRVLINVVSKVYINLCAAAYTFDLYINHGHEIGGLRRYFDISLPFDSNIPFDSDEIELFSDGWIGLSLTGRFEQDYPYHHCMDTFVSSSSTYLGGCCYEGFYAQCINTERSDIDLTISAIVSGSVVTTLAMLWTLQSPNGTKWNVTVNNDGSLLTTDGSLLSVDNWKIQRTDLTEVSFSITNNGQLQVIEPADPSATLLSLLEVKSVLGDIWSITVNNNNQIITTM